jgi:HlyD family secretion protein
MFKVDQGGRTAARTNVRLGRSSVNTVEVLGGLREGDVVILSDMTAWERAERVRLR